MVKMLDALIGISIGLIVIVAVFSIAPLIGDKVSTAAEVENTVGATGTISFTDNTSDAEAVVIGTETYTFNTTTTIIPFEVDISGGVTATLSTTALVSTIERDSTLVDAVDNSDNSTTVTSIIKGTAGNSYASTETCANASWGGTTLSGGLNNVWGEEAMTSANADAVSIWTDNASLISLAVLVMILGIVIAAIMVFGGRTE